MDCDDEQPLHDDHEREDDGEAAAAADGGARQRQEGHAPLQGRELQRHVSADMSKQSKDRLRVISHCKL